MTESDNTPKASTTKGGFFSFLTRKKNTAHEELLVDAPSTDTEHPVLSQDVPLTTETAPTTPATETPLNIPAIHDSITVPEEGIAAAVDKPAESFFTRLKSRLSRTRENLTEGLGDLFLGKKTIDDDVLEELETRLILADVGVEVTRKIIDKLTAQVSRKALADVDMLLAALRTEMIAILQPVSLPLQIERSAHQTPYIILMVGVNGVGKTTTIGKLAKQFQAQGKRVMLAAGDTFRAAAVEQLQVWGERNQIPVVAQSDGADSASVIFDAVQAAQSRQIDILIADTAGRLHTQAGLMQELAKIRRVIQKIDATAPHETMLVVDASTGQNALNQAVQFNAATPISGITLTKLDGTAKGGIVFAIADKLNIPLRYIGVGEGIDDLKPFDANEFVNALIGNSRNT